MDPPRVTEKRRRPPVSCEPCRLRKLRCNRSLPCDTCMKRDIGSECQYAPNANRAKSATPRPRAMGERLTHLEAFVTSMLANGMPTTPPRSVAPKNVLQGWDATTTLPSTYSPAMLTPSEGGDDSPLGASSRRPFQDSQGFYVDASHWTSILDDIQEIKGHLAVPRELETHATSETSVDSDRLVESNVRTPTTKDILALLPSRSVCDNLVSFYFNTWFMNLGILHPHKFQKEYTAFWDAPYSIRPVWLALLFALMSVATGLRTLSGMAPSTEPLATISSLQRATKACLTVGQYRSSKDTFVEAYLLHLLSCYLSHDQSPAHLWFEMGELLRIAIRLSYHREPSQLKGISAFDGEMRRRVWINVFQLDALMSYQMGLPSMIPADACSTKPPSNLHYADFHPSMTVLPASRPLTEQTPIFYCIVKAEVMAAFKQVTTTSHTGLMSWTAMVELGAKVKQVYTDMPAAFKSEDISRSFMDPVSLIWQRCTIELLHLKTLIILYRPSLSEGNAHLEPCRIECIEAALTMLHRQGDLHEACQPGGRLFEDRGKMMTIPPHDFLLAAMVICLYMSSHQASRTAENVTLAARCHQDLLKTRDIWAAAGPMWSEARTATIVLNVMIEKLLAHMDDQARSGPAGGWTQDVAFDTSEDQLLHAEGLDRIISGRDDMDWALIDQYLLNKDPASLDLDFEI